MNMNVPTWRLLATTFSLPLFVGVLAALATLPDAPPAPAGSTKLAVGISLIPPVGGIVLLVLGSLDSSNSFRRWLDRSGGSRALIKLWVLIGILLGIPAGLIALIGSPWPLDHVSARHREGQLAFWLLEAGSFLFSLWFARWHWRVVSGRSELGANEWIEDERVLIQVRGRQASMERARLNAAWARLGIKHRLIADDRADEEYAAAWTQGERNGFTPFIASFDHVWPGMEFKRIARIPPEQLAVGCLELAEEFKRIACDFEDETGFSCKSKKDLEEQIFERIPMVEVLKAERPRPFTGVAGARLWHVPTTSAWQVLGMLSPREVDCDHVELLAIAKHWAGKYGASPAGYVQGSLVFHVDQPPTDAREAVRLLVEHLAFYALETNKVPDLSKFDQLATRAALLVGNHWWVLGNFPRL